MTAGTTGTLETGWHPTTPVDDNLFRQFLHNQAVVNDITARTLGGRAERTDAVFLADAGSPVPYLNQAVLSRPLTGTDDPALTRWRPSSPADPTRRRCCRSGPRRT